ncbi:MAG TPA: M48 family metallopeptidase [Vicinamibacterales bacterium]|nr:M48 family metallopeptidase [Vicinamibacterales bacterium]
MKLLSRLALVMTLTATTVVAQTKVTPPKNKYTPQQDVQIGREAAQEVRSQYPIINDDHIRGYLDRLGDRLVEAAPRELNNPVFEYSFTPVNLKDINAFALPGGPMFVNRGMVEAASNEAEVAGVMAHELAHVLLRHGTANASKQQGAQIGAIAGAIAGAIIGGGWGNVIAQGSQFGLGTWLMKYSREYEKQADLVGAQIMARAGYDPRALAHMFETIQKQGGRGGPEWLSSHPNPGNRTQYITAEANQLRIGPRPSDQGFLQAKSRLAQLGPARTMAELERGGGNGGGGGRGGSTASVGRIGEPVPAPARQYRTVQGGQLFTTSIPANWQAVTSNSSIKYVPQNAYGEHEGQTTLTHGVELGVARASSRDLNEATQTLVEGFLRSNDGMRLAGGPEQFSLSGRRAIVTPLIGRSALGGGERVDVHTTMLSNGDLFYVLTVVPEREVGYYSQAFDRVIRSVRLNDR